jgi:hypothetical protein
MNITKLGLASLLSTIGLLGAAGSAGAVGIILSPTGATVNSGGTANLFGVPLSNIADTYNQNGLTTGFASGSADFDTVVATSRQSKSAGEWFKDPLNGNASVVTYNLGSVYSIDRLALWNEDLTGINSFNLSYSTDGISFSSLASGLTPTNNPFGLTGTYGADVFSFATTSAQYVRFEGLSCPFGACSIGEVAFASTQTKQVPEPSGIVGTSVLAIGLIGRKILKHRKQREIAAKLID